jgi:hypothetical protein
LRSCISHLRWKAIFKDGKHGIPNNHASWKEATSSPASSSDAIRWTKIILTSSLVTSSPLPFLPSLQFRAAARFTPMTSSFRTSGLALDPWAKSLTSPLNSSCVKTADRLRFHQRPGRDRYNIWLPLGYPLFTRRRTVMNPMETAEGKYESSRVPHFRTQLGQARRISERLSVRAKCRSGSNSFCQMFLSTRKISILVNISRRKPSIPINSSLARNAMRRVSYRISSFPIIFRHQIAKDKK